MESSLTGFHIFAIIDVTTDMITTLPNRKLSDQAYDAIKADIIACVLLPGCQITQPQFVERYDFNIASVREALQKLEKEGLVEPIPRSGYRIRPITLADVREIYELRYALELTAVRLACLRGSDAQLQAILTDAGFTYLDCDPSSYSDYLFHNAAFHCSIAAASANHRLAGLVSGVMDDLTRVLHLGLERARPEITRLEHLELAQALASRQEEKAERLVRSLMERSQQVVLESLSMSAAGSLQLR
jgi:DNA-binding GntR family transcriptional regulator